MKKYNLKNTKIKGFSVIASRAKQSLIIIADCFVVLLLAMTFNCNPAFAFTETTSGGQLSADIFPEDPGALTATSINLISYEVDLGTSNIIWTVNGKKQKEGIGQTDLQFTTGDVGKKVLVDIEVISQDGKDITKEISIIPAETDIIWQSNGYVPPLYKGKSLVATGDTIKLSAISNFITESGIRIDPSKLLYRWRFNSTDIDSGYGKRNISVTLTNSKSENTFFVDVSTLDETIKSSKIIQVKNTEPVFLFYKNNPLTGTLYENSILDNLQMSEPETIIRLEPYYINTQKATYAWGINDTAPAPTPNNSNQLTIRQPTNNVGEAILNVLITTPYQSAKKSITIKFGRLQNF